MAMIKRELQEIKWTKEDQGQEVTGVLIRIETVQYSDGPGLRYLLKGDRPGQMISFAGTAGLNRRLHSGDVGKRISVTFTGLEDASRVQAGLSQQKLFSVAVDDSGSGGVPSAVNNAHPVADGAPIVDYEGQF